MRFRTDLSIGVLGQPDPEGLWEEIISHIPDSVLLKVDVKILCVAAGHGTEAKILARRMRELGKTRAEIKDSIYLLDKYMMFTNALEMRGFTNVIQCDFLKWETDMKFDVVVGNPPYQDSDSSAHNKKLWHSFTDVALSIGDLIAFVTPSSWVYADTSQMNSIRRKITRAGHVSSVVDTTHHFNVGVDTCYWIVDTKKPSNDTLINGTPYPLHKMPFKTENDIIADCIYDKLKSYTSIEFKSFNGDITRNQVCDAGDHLIYFSGNKPMYTNSHVDGAGVGKFVAPFSASPHNVFWTTEATGMLNQTIICDEATAEEYKAMWKLNVVKFFINTYRKTSGFTPAIRNGLIPDLRGYDNQQSYDVLDLTDEEIAYIEDNI